jgi:hypothetical protein
VGGGAVVAARYQAVPNAFTLRSITYTPDHGPSNSLLLTSRPERILQQYLDDYVHLAGTYPCQADLSRLYDEDTDPVLSGQPCAVVRPVASVAITRVTILAQGLVRQPSARLHIVVTYTSGERWEHDQGMIPDEYQLGWGIFWTHLDCWSSLGTLELFGKLVPDIPAGADYVGPHLAEFHCKH